MTHKNLQTARFRGFSYDKIAYQYDIRQTVGTAFQIDALCDWIRAEMGFYRKL